MFCTFCGSTYDVKLCPRLHPNPRYAEVCAQCGSREMTAPQPKIPLPLKFLILILRVTPKFLFWSLLLSATLLFCHWLLTDPAGQRLLVCILLLTGSFFIAWKLLPPSMQRLLRSAARLTKRAFVSPRKGERRRT